MQNISINFHQLSTRSFARRVQFVLEKIWTEHNTFAIDNAVKSALTMGNFKTDCICPIWKNSDDEYLVEMFYGPSGNFKDAYSLILPYMISPRKLAVMATSGNGALAAMHGFTQANRTKLLIFYPKNSIQDNHYLELATNSNENVVAVGVDADLEDIQAKLDEVARQNEKLAQLHSINYGKTAPLAAFIIASYCELLANKEIKIGEPINVVLPFTHTSLESAYDLAINMGLPASSIETKKMIIVTQNEEEAVAEDFSDKLILNDAIVTLNGMENFIEMVNL